VELKEMLAKTEMNFSLRHSKQVLFPLAAIFKMNQGILNPNQTFAS